MSEIYWLSKINKSKVTSVVGIEAVWCCFYASEIESEKEEEEEKWKKLSIRWWTVDSGLQGVPMPCKTLPLEKKKGEKETKKEKKSNQNLHNGYSKWRCLVRGFAPIKHWDYVVNIGHSLGTLRLIFTFLPRLLRMPHYNPIKVPLIWVFSSFLSSGGVIDVQAYGSATPWCRL